MAVQSQNIPTTSDNDLHIVKQLCIDANVLKVSIKHTASLTQAANKEHTITDIWTVKVCATPAKQ